MAYNGKFPEKIIVGKCTGKGPHGIPKLSLQYNIKMDAMLL
jgi:hypothetical protein